MDFVFLLCMPESVATVSSPALSQVRCSRGQQAYPEAPEWELSIHLYNSVSGDPLWSCQGFRGIVEKHSDRVAKLCGFQDSRLLLPAHCNPR